jgi:hypothetical protein
LISAIVGVLLVALGTLVVGNFGRVATRIYNFYTSFMAPGHATVGTVRLVGIFFIAVGSGWVVTSLPI